MVLVLAVSGLPGQAPEGRPRPRRVAILCRDAVPTHRSLARSLARLLPAGAVRRIAPGARLDRELELLDAPGDTVLVTLGEALARRALAGTARVPLVLAAPRDAALPARRRVAGGGPGRVVRLDLSVPEGEVAAALAALLPECRCVGVISSRTWEGIAPETLSVAWSPSHSPAGMVESLAPQVDALMLPDEEATLAVAEELLLEAHRRRLPVITTAPWLARSGAAVGVVPDLEEAAARLYVAILAVAEGRAPARVPVAARRVVDLGAWRRLGLPVDAVRLAAADDIRAPGPEEEP